MDIFSRIVDFLVAKKVDFVLMSHEPVYTSEEAALAKGTSLESGAKAIIAKADRFIMLVLPSNLKIDSKKVKRIFGVKNFRFADDMNYIN